MKQIGHIWIGPHPAPTKWMLSWQRFHPDAPYKLYDNDFILKFKFKNQAHIDEMIDRRHFHGAADLIRYELLYALGGFIPEADSICVKNTDALFSEETCYTVYENEFLRGKLVSPIIASNPNNKFLELLIDQLHEIDPKSLGDPWKSTGNLFCAKMIETHNPKITIFPSFYFNPLHHTGLLHQNYQSAYAIQLWGSTKGTYKSATLFTNIREKHKVSRGKKNTKAIDKKTLGYSRAQILQHFRIST